MKLWPVYRMEFYSVVKNKIENILYVGKWMGLGKVRLREVTQALIKK